LIIVALANQVFVNQAMGSDKWLKFYKCDDEHQARLCLGCKLDKEVQVKFLVSRGVGGRTVISYMKEGWWTIHPPVDLGKNGACAVVNEKNWVCSTKTESPSMQNYIAQREMVNGIYSSYASFYNPSAQRLVELHTCAK